MKGEWILDVSTVFLPSVGSCFQWISFKKKSTNHSAAHSKRTVLVVGEHNGALEWNMEKYIWNWVIHRSWFWFNMQSTQNLNQIQILFQRLMHCSTSVHQIVFLCVKTSTFWEWDRHQKRMKTKNKEYYLIYPFLTCTLQTVPTTKGCVRKKWFFFFYHFTDCPHIWPPGLSHIPRSHSRPLTHSQKEDNTFCTCPDFVYAFSCDLKVGVALRSYGLETVCE